MKRFKTMPCLFGPVRTLEIIVAVAGAVLVFYQSVEAFQGPGNVFHETPFQIRMDLDFHFPLLSYKNNIQITTEKQYPIDNEAQGQGILNDDEMARKNTNNGQQQKLKVYFSQLYLNVRDIDPQRKSLDAETKAQTFMSLPSKLINNHYGDLMHSIGTIIEPQLNLGIEF